MARKPLSGTVAGNVLEWGTGALNIDASRVESEPRRIENYASKGSEGMMSHGFAGGAGHSGRERTARIEHAGRWPANVLLDPEAAAAMDEQSGNLPTQKARKNPGKETTDSGMFGIAGKQKNGPEYLGDSGGASRFFPVFKYQAKAPAKERPFYTIEDGTEVKHATVKPLELMRWLVRLVTPPDGIVLDPFAGSGTTLEAALMEGFTPVGIEAESDYIPLIEARLSRVEDTLEATL